MTTYRLTGHASTRIKQRQLSTEELVAALAGRRREIANDGRVIIYDPKSRVAVIVDSGSGHILTAFRLKKKQVKRFCSK